MKKHSDAELETLQQLAIKTDKPIVVYVEFGFQALELSKKFPNLSFMVWQEPGIMPGQEEFLEGCFKVWSGLEKPKRFS